VPLMEVSGFGLSTAEDMACLKRVFWKNRDDLKDDRDRKMNCREIFLQLGSDGLVEAQTEPCSISIEHLRQSKHN
jgi:hypothetical protein